MYWQTQINKEAHFSNNPLRMFLKYGNIFRPWDNPVSIIPVLIHSVYERRSVTPKAKQHVSFPKTTSVREVP